METDMDRPFKEYLFRARARRRMSAMSSALVAGTIVAGTFIAVPAMAQEQFLVAKNLTVTNMISEADPLVKAVMALLLLASLATWTILIAKANELSAAKRKLRADLRLMEDAPSMPDAGDVKYSATAAMINLARREMQRGGDLRSAAAVEGIKERVTARLSVVETNAVQSILTGVNILASIGATSPFIGLAGTVWGIMNSFIGISKAHATNLAVVAPGIAEALLATAMGLMAAIPAVLIYNALARSIAGYRRMIGEVAVLTACALSRELEDKAISASEARPLVRATA